MFSSKENDNDDNDNDDNSSEEDEKSSDDSSDDDSENSQEDATTLSIEEKTKKSSSKPHRSSKKHTKASINKPFDPNYKKTLFIQMEFCAELTLRHLLDSDKPMPPLKEKINLILQILDALIFIHEQDMIHRDMKPSNIFLDKDFKVKLGDFGLATTKDKKELNFEETKSASKDSVKDHFRTLSKGVGTPLYSSPEQQVAGKYNEKVFNTAFK